MENSPRLPLLPEPPLHADEYASGSPPSEGSNKVVQSPVSHTVPVRAGSPGFYGAERSSQGDGGWGDSAGEQEPARRRRPSSQAEQTPEGAGVVGMASALVTAAVEGFMDIPRDIQLGVDVVRSTHLRELQRLYDSSAIPDRMNDGVLLGAKGAQFAPGTPLGEVPGMMPSQGPGNQKTILYVNGIMTPTDYQVREMHAIADRSGAPVVGLHNATQGRVSDLLQCVADKMDKGCNPAVDSLANTLYTELKEGRDVHLMGYSQGGLVTARALSLRVGSEVSS